MLYNAIDMMLDYRASNMVIVISLTEGDWFLLDEGDFFLQRNLALWVQVMNPHCAIA